MGVGRVGEGFPHGRGKGGVAHTYIGKRVVDLPLKGFFLNLYTPEKNCKTNYVI